VRSGEDGHVVDERNLLSWTTGRDKIYVWEAKLGTHTFKKWDYVSSCQMRMRGSAGGILASDQLLSGLAARLAGLEFRGSAFGRGDVVG
jgi:hypothetical protein